VAETLVSAATLEEAARRLVDEANEAGGRDNITVVLCRFEEVESGTPVDQPTIVGGPTPPDTSEHMAESGAPSRSGVAVASPPAGGTRLSPRHERKAAPTHRRRRLTKPVAGLVALVVVLLLIAAGGYLASRQ